MVKQNVTILYYKYENSINEQKPYTIQKYPMGMGQGNSVWPFDGTKQKPY